MRLASIRRAFALGVAAATFAAPAAGAFSLFSVGSGEISGNYYAAAKAICDLMNRAAAGEMRCSPEPTVGSIYNLEALRQGQIEFAFVQSDWQRAAYDGSGQYAAAGPMRELRSVFSLYPEAVTVLVRREAGVSSAADLAGKRIDIGQPASGRRATALWLLREAGVETGDFAVLRELAAGNAVDELCAGRIDATMLVVGHPNAAVARALADCDAEILPVAPELRARLVENNAEVAADVIRAGVYPQLAADLPTIAVRATLATREDADPEQVEALVLTTLSGLDALGSRAPVLRGLDPEAMLRAGLTAPLHPAAHAAFEALGVK